MLGLGECKGSYGVNWERYGEIYHVAHKIYLRN